MNFILAHAADYGVDARRFVVGGGSAGGHLALLLGLARQEREFGANPAIKPLAILDFFGPADLNGMKDDLQTIHSQKGLETWQEPGQSCSARRWTSPPPGQSRQPHHLCERRCAAGLDPSRRRR